jgi:hypothetical protein
MVTRTKNDFLSASTVAAMDLASAQGKRASLEARANERLVRSKQRHGVDLAEARQVEAAAWRRLMAIPGMTAATAAQIGGTTVIKVSRWVAADDESTSCN